jgi:hypothetical protein
MGAYVLLKAYALGPALSDEYIYFYMCRRIAEGAIPYRDFFFAHPPLHLLPGAALAALAGFSVPVARALPAASGLLAAAAVYRAGRRAGVLEGIASLTIFLFAYDLLRASSHYTGAMEATALVAWSFERALAGRPAASGALAGAAALVALYALAPAAGIGAVLLLAGAGAALRFGAGLAAVFGSVNLLCLAAFGRRYWEPVFRYHLLKPEGADAEAASSLLHFAAENNWIAWGAPAAGAAWFLLRRGTRPARLALDDPWAPAIAGLAAGAVHLAALGLSARVFSFYFLPAFPALALAAGTGCAAALRAVAAARAPDPVRPGAIHRAAAAAAAGAILLAGAPILRAALLRAAEDLPRSEPDRYVWKEAPLPGTLNAAVRAILWREAAPAAWTPAVTRYLQHESLRFTAPADLAARVRSMTPEGGSVFGDSLTAPLVALLGGRPIALDEVDTNHMRFASGVTPPVEIIERLEGAPPAAVIAAPARGFYTIPEMASWISGRYRLVAAYHDPLYGPHLLFLRRPEEGAGAAEEGPER